jgi:hypothetical protein
VFLCIYDSQPGSVCMSWITNPIPGLGGEIGISIG